MQSVGLLGIGILLLCVAGTAHAASTRQVAVGGVDAGDCVSASCGGLQYAIDQAASGDTVAVGAGTFVGQATVVGKDLTIAGAGSAQTTIAAPNAAIALLGGASVRRAVLGATAQATVSIEDLTIDGAGHACAVYKCASGYANQRFTGLGVLDSDATVRRVRVVGVREPYSPAVCPGSTDAQLSENQQGTPIHASATSGTHTIVVRDSVFSDFQKNAMTLTESGAGTLDATVAGNTVVGGGNQCLQQQNGIQLGVGASGDVSGNVVRDFRYVGTAQPYQVGAGLIVAEVDRPTRVADNAIEASDIAIAAFGSSAGVPIVLEDNRLLANGKDIYGTAVELDTGTFALEGNLIDGTSAHTAGGTGFIGVLIEPDATVATLTGNRIRGNQTGVQVLGGDVTVSGSGNAITGNDLGVANADVEALSLIGNWWGCNAGPGESGCDTVAGPVDVAPWLVLAARATPAEIAIDGAQSTVTASIDGMSTGQAAASPAPDGIPVAFQTDLGSLATQGSVLAGGSATSVLTSGVQHGTATIGITVDHQAVTQAVRIVPAPASALPAPPRPPAIEPAPPAPAPNDIADEASQVRGHPGSALVVVTAPGAGTLTGRGTTTIGGKRVRILVAKAAIGGAGPIRVRLRLPAAAQSQLARRGRLPLTLAITFTAMDGTPTLARERVTIAAPRSVVLRGHWVGKSLGPWKAAPSFSARARNALRFIHSASGVSRATIRR